MPTTFDINQAKDYIATVENHTAEFIGSQFIGARIIGFISQQHRQGHVSDDQAQDLLADATHMMRLAKLGQHYAKLARNPAPELRIIVLAEEKRTARAEGKLYA